VTGCLTDDPEPELLAKSHEGRRSEWKDSGHGIHDEVVVKESEATALHDLLSDGQLP
jgi:hypothetical protein